MSERLLVLDTETTGFSPTQGDRLIEVGIIELIDRKPSGRYFHEYIDPEREVPDSAVAIHGMTRDDLIQAGEGRKFEDIADNLVAFIDGATLVIHNAKFDMGFLDFELSRSGREKLTGVCPVFDTLIHANKVYPGKKNNLDALTKRLAVQAPDRSLHGALLDAEILAQVFLAMTQKQSQFVLDQPSHQASTKRSALTTRKLSEAISSKLPNISVSQQEKDDNFNYF
jgi:DNA polymerase-3 subunit epsilon